ncbi:putative transporter [Fusarium oxysporum]|uniref:Putative transporter n=1 Tax=Fusarium oxysporum TaxID=5507 RepID=A0A420QXU8_FUSOX|nr:putative transporter [Fusarium oxysporum]
MAAVGDSKGVIGKTDSEDQGRFDSGDETANSSIEHPFSDPEIADRWRKVYENAQYENRHRFDPSFTWTAQEEKKLVRKIDFRICLWAWVMFLSLDFHRRNINRAISDNMLPEVGMNTNDFNYGQTSNELPIRLAFFWTALSTSNILGSLLAAGILQMRGVLGWGGWRWLFLLEAIGTFIIGLFSWVLMPPGPCQTKSWFRGKNGWFNEREEYIMVNRLLRDDPSKGDMNNREAVNLSKLWKAVKDWEQWPLYIIGLMVYIPPAPFNTYLSFILRQIGFSVFEANLLAIPSQFLYAVNLLIITWLSERVKERGMLSSLSNIWIFPWVLALVVLPGDISPWVRYALITGLLSYPYCHAILVGWNAKNSNSVRTRAISAALYNMFVQTGNIAASNIFREDDQPLYRRGNRVILGITSANIVLFYIVKAFYVWRNKVRDARWNALTKEQQQDYILNTTDEGQQRLDFRFAH